MWTLGLAGVSDWLLSGGSDGSLTCWRLDVTRLQKKIRKDLANEAREEEDEEDNAGNGPECGRMEEEAEDKEYGPSNGAVDLEDDQGENIVTKAIQAHENSIYDIVVAGDLVFTGADEEIRIWRKPWDVDVEDVTKAVHLEAQGELRIPQIQGSRGSMSPVAETNGLATLDNDSKIAAAAGDSLAYLYDVETEKLCCKFSGHRAYLHAVAALERSGLIATASEDGTCKIWDHRVGASGGCVQTILVGELATALAVSEDGNWLAMGGRRAGRAHVGMCHVASHTVTAERCLSGNMKCAQAMVFADSNLVIAGDSPVLEYWTHNGTEHVVSIPTSSPSVFSLYHDRQTGLLATGGSSPWLDVFSSERNQMMSLCTAL